MATAAVHKPAGALNRLAAFLFRPVDIASLVVFRIAFGITLVVEVIRYSAYGWISDYVDPSFHFTYYGFEWVKPWPGNGMFIHFLVMGLAGAGIAAGLLYRLAALVAFITFSHVFLIEQATYLNHWYLMCLLCLLMIFVPAHRAFSIDAIIWPRIRSTYVPMWALGLIVAQLSIVYIYGGIAKLNGDWLRGEPMRTWMAGRTDVPLIGPWLQYDWFIVLLNYGGLIFDLFIVPLLLWRRTRILAILWVTAFHVLNSQMFRIGVFPWLMLAATIVFLPPEWSRKLLQLFGWRPRAPVPAFQFSGAVAALLAAYLGIQLLLPFRHILYPGSVHWTEEGHRYSWHMKLRSKKAKVRFVVTDPVKKISWEVHPRDYLLPFQASKMAPRPDMILQLAHHIARQEAAGLGLNYPLEVRAKATASLHGRPKQYLIDPSVDLAKVKRSLGHAKWIMPLLPEGSPPLREETEVAVGERPLEALVNEAMIDEDTGTAPVPVLPTKASSAR